MYRKDLENDLKKIFGIKKIVFSQVEYGAEQDVLYVDILSTRNRPMRGYYYFAVSGSIGLNAQYGNTKSGFFHSKWLESHYENKTRLNLGAREVNINFTQMNKYFCKNRIDFVYRIKIPFNPAKKTKGINLLFSQITKLFKGSK